MAECEIKVTFEDGSIGVQMKGGSMDLIAGCVTMVRAMYTSLGDAHGGDLAQIIFKHFVQGGIPFDDKNFKEDRREECESEDELEEKMKASRAKKQLADIVELLVKGDTEEEKNDGEV